MSLLTGIVLIFLFLPNRKRCSCGWIFRYRSLSKNTFSIVFANTALVSVAPKTKNWKATSSGIPGVYFTKDC